MYKLFVHLPWEQKNILINDIFSIGISFVRAGLFQPVFKLSMSFEKKVYIVFIQSCVDSGQG
jgi:hypothetical protein